MNKIRIGILGATSYTARELIILLLRHSLIELEWLTSESETGQLLDNVYPLFKGTTAGKLTLKFFKEVEKTSPDIVFSCLPHGVSASFTQPFLENAKTRVIDLSADFRISNLSVYEHYYKTTHPCPHFLEKAEFGLSEWSPQKIAKSKCIGNPGCYPTSILLPLLPLIEGKKISLKNIIMDAKSGVSGAGKSLSKATHYSESNESFTAYSIADQHRHISEIREQLMYVANANVDFLFTAHLIPMDRGILTTIYVDLEKNVSQQDILDTYKLKYKNSSFVFIIDKSPSTKDVKNTNNCLIYPLVVPSQPQKMVIVSVIDNLIKGASGQAVQNMNLMMGLPENKDLS